MENAASPKTVEIAVPQRYKEFVVRRQYQWFWIAVPAALGGINLVYYLLCVAFHWTWKLHFQGDMILPLLGMAAYVLEARKPWRYEINERAIKLFVVTPRTHLANLKEIAWAKTEVVGIEQAEWQGLSALKMTVLPTSPYVYWLVYSPSDEEDVEIKVIPLIEKYRRSYRQEIWADKLRT